MSQMMNDQVFDNVDAFAQKHLALKCGNFFILTRKKKNAHCGRKPQ